MLNISENWLNIGFWLFNWWFEVMDLGFLDGQLQPRYTTREVMVLLSVGAAATEEPEQVFTWTKGAQVLLLLLTWIMEQKAESSLWCVPAVWQLPTHRPPQADGEDQRAARRRTSCFNSQNLMAPQLLLLLSVSAQQTQTICLFL